MEETVSRSYIPIDTKLEEQDYNSNKYQDESPPHLSEKQYPMLNQHIHNRTSTKRKIGKTIECSNFTMAVYESESEEETSSDDGGGDNMMEYG